MNDHEKLREEWIVKAHKIRDENDYISTKDIADWWLSKISEQEERHQEELELRFSAGYHTAEIKFGEMLEELAVKVYLEIMGKGNDFVMYGFKSDNDSMKEGYNKGISDAVSLIREMKKKV